MESGRSLIIHFRSALEAALRVHSGAYSNVCDIPLQKGGACTVKAKHGVDMVPQVGTEITLVPWHFKLKHSVRVRKIGDRQQTEIPRCLVSDPSKQSDTPARGR
jgi:hypothetical protein